MTLLNSCCSAANISARTGAKCLSASHIPRCRGLVLHDSHAEILAIRAFNYWLLTECHGVLAAERELLEQGKDETEQTTPSISPFIRRRSPPDVQTDSSSISSIQWPPFEIQPDIRLYMYCTCAPCGDASMELCMAAQEDATPWEVIRQTDFNCGAVEDTLLDGRAHFSLLGVVRRKPSRMDAIPTRSKSCSDKLALRQVSSLLSAQTSRLVAPTENAYLAGLVLPEDEISRVGFERSFGTSGRMKALTGRAWPGSMKYTDSTTGYGFRPFDVFSVPAEEIAALWQFAKPKVTTNDPEVGPKKSKPGNVSAVWTAAPTYLHSCMSTVDTGRKFLPALRRTPTGLYETIINGVKQGNKAHAPGARGASALSRAKLWALLLEVLYGDPSHDGSNIEGQKEVSTMGPGERAAQQQVHQARTYEKLKQAGSDETDSLHVRREAILDTKQVLKGWIPNAGDEDWGLDVLNDPKKRER